MRVEFFKPSGLRNSTLKFVLFVLKFVHTDTCLSISLTHHRFAQLFYINQSAYRHLHSAQTAMLRVTNDLLVSTGSGSPVFLVTLDLTAAFDNVNHEKLVNRLTCEFGVTGCLLTWIKSYLHGRQQCVKISDCAARMTSCDCSVPQGSVL